MKDTQERLDKAQAILQRTIRALDALAADAGSAADELCTEGDFANSSEVGLIGAELREAAAHADRAYRMARRLEVGGIRPKSGKD